MDTFDRFSVTVSGATQTKTSSADARARQTSYPDSEFGLVLVSGARKVRLLPMSTLVEVKTSEQQLAELVEHQLLPEGLSHRAGLRLTKRSSALGAPVISPDIALCDVEYWQNDSDGLFWREREAAHRAKTSTATPEHPILSTFAVRTRTVELRTLGDVSEAVAFLEKDSRHMTSVECRGLAKAVVQATMALGGCEEREALGKFSADSKVSAFTGTLPRPDAPRFFRQRATEVRMGKTSMLDPTKVSSIAKTYEQVADVVERWQELDPHVVLPRLEELAERVDALNKASGLRSEHVHRVLFLGHGEDAVFKTSTREWSDGYEYTFGSTHIRASEIERLANVHLGQLKRILPAKVLADMQEKPLETFRSLTAPQKRAVARFCEETIKVRDLDEMIPTLL